MRISLPLTIARVISGLFFAVALGVLGFGAIAMVDDLRSRGEFLDGLAAIVGGLMVAGALPVLALTAVVLFTHRPVRAACCGLAVSGLVVSGSAVVLVVFMRGEPFEPWSSLVMILGLALGAASLLVLLHGRHSVGKAQLAAGAVSAPKR